MEGSNYWGHGYKTQHSYPRSRLITWRRPEVKFGRNVVKKKQHKNYQDEDKKSAIYFYSWRWYLCEPEKQSQRVRAHERVVGKRKSQWTTEFSQNSGTYIVYNSHVTCINSSFSLAMVRPTSRFFDFHWLCCFFPIGFLQPKLTSVSGRICHHRRIQPRP